MGQAAERDALLSRWLDLVAQVSVLTAEAQRLNQKLAGVEMDVLRLELELGRSGAIGQLVRDLHEAKANAAALRQAGTVCEQRIAAAEADLDEVGRSLSGSGN